MYKILKQHLLLLFPNRPKVEKSMSFIVHPVLLRECRFRAGPSPPLFLFLDHFSSLLVRVSFPDSDPPTTTTRRTKGPKWRRVISGQRESQRGTSSSSSERAISFSKGKPAHKREQKRTIFLFSCRWANFLTLARNPPNNVRHFIRAIEGRAANAGSKKRDEFIHFLHHPRSSFHHGNFCSVSSSGDLQMSRFWCRPILSSSCSLVPSLPGPDVETTD